MAAKRKRRKPGRSSGVNISAVDDNTGGADEMSPVERRSDPRPFLYGGLDLALAALQAYLFASVLPPPRGSAAALVWALVSVTAIMGCAMMVRRRWAWWAAAAGCAALLVAVIVMFGLLLSSAGFLAGVYGSFGKGAASMMILAGALLVEALGLVPALQLKFLMTRAGRRSFGLAPVWRKA